MFSSVAALAPCNQQPAAPAWRHPATFCPGFGQMSQYKANLIPHSCNQQCFSDRVWPINTLNKAVNTVSLVLNKQSAWFSFYFDTYKLHGSSMKELFIYKMSSFSTTMSVLPEVQDKYQALTPFLSTPRQDEPNAVWLTSIIYSL